VPGPAATPVASLSSGPREVAGDRLQAGATEQGGKFRRFRYKVPASSPSRCRIRGSVEARMAPFSVKGPRRLYSAVPACREEVRPPPLWGFPNNRAAAERRAA